MNDLERFAGVDRGSENHQVCVTGCTGVVFGERVFRHGGAGLAEMADWIAATAGAEPHVTGIAIEVPHGPVVETLMERDFLVHSINPKQLDRFRDRFSPADALHSDAHAYRRIDIAVRDPALPEGKGLQGVLSDAPVDDCRMNIEGSCNVADRVSVFNWLVGRSLFEFCAGHFGIRPPVRLRPGVSRSPSSRAIGGRIFLGMW